MVGCAGYTFVVFAADQCFMRYAAQLARPPREMAARGPWNDQTDAHRVA